MIPYTRDNKGYRYLLTIIDIFSKYAWDILVKRKTGKEFYNTDFQKLMSRYKIKLYSIYCNLKTAICERFNRTLKNAMWKKFSLRGNYK